MAEPAQTPGRPDAAGDSAARAARDWIVRLNSGDVSEDELARFRIWRAARPEHDLAFRRERAFWSGLQGLEAAPEPAPRRLLARRGFLAGGAAMAAAAAGVVVTPRLALAMRADFITATGEMAQHALPDGSIAALNTDSALALDFAPGRRAVRLLKGEAEFTVVPGAGDFTVLALDGRCALAQGRFCLRIEDGQALATALQGQLGVASGDGPALAVPPGRQTRYRPGLAPAAPQPVDAEAVAAWRGGRVIFESRPFAEAVAELGRYLPERLVIAPGVDGRVPVSGMFSTDQALAALDALARTQGRHLRRVPGVLILIA